MQFSMIHCFFGFYAAFFEECNVQKCRDQQGRPTYTTLIKFLLIFQSNSTDLRFLMMNFTSEYSLKNDFLGYFLSGKNAVFSNQFFMIFALFFVWWRICHSDICRCF